MALSERKLLDLGLRVYNNKMIEDETNGVSDANDIRELCQRTFGDGSTNPDPSMLHKFNNVLVQTADVAVKPKMENMVDVLANRKSANRGDIILYQVPKKNKVRLVWSALGSGVEMVRIGLKEKISAVPKVFSFGAYYEPLDMVRDSVDAFRDAVDAIAEAKITLYYNKIGELIDAAITSGDIPDPNVLEGANLTIAQYRGLESKLIRYGGRPVFVADSLLINHFGTQIATDGTYKELLTDGLRESILSDLVLAQLSRSIAVTISNPFTNENNNAVEHDVNVGYMFAGGQGGKKPFYITEFGGMRQLTDQDMEDERIKLKITQEADVTLMVGEALGYIKDTSVSL